MFIHKHMNAHKQTHIHTQTLHRVYGFTSCLQFAERALAHHLLDPVGGPSAEYHISLAHLKLQKHQMEEAEKSLQEALQFDHQVREK